MKAEHEPGVGAGTGAPAQGLAEGPGKFEPASRPLLGRRLLETGKIDAAALSAALESQKREGGRLGRILMAEGHLNALDLHRALGRQLGLPFVNLMETPPDPELMTGADPAFCLEHLCLPWRRAGAQEIYVSADPARTRAALEAAGRPALIYVTSTFDLLWTAGAHFKEKLTARARLALSQAMPHASARTLTTPALRRTAMSLCVLLLFAFLFFGAATLGALNLFAGGVFLTLAALRAFSLVYGLKPLPPPVLKRPARDLPHYTIMVPLLREAAVLPGLTAALQALDYPGIR